jgi:hypothetical protein
MTTVDDINRMAATCQLGALVPATRPVIAEAIMVEEWRRHCRAIGATEDTIDAAYLDAVRLHSHDWNPDARLEDRLQMAARTLVHGPQP